MRDRECDTGPWHWQSLMPYSEFAFRRNSRDVYVFSHIPMCKCSHPSSKKKELLQLGKIKGCICIPQYFVDWPWNIFADTVSVLKVGMGQIQSDENRWKKGDVVCLCAQQKWLLSLTLLYGPVKDKRRNNKRKGETRSGIRTEGENWGLLALQQAPRTPAWTPHVVLSISQDSKGQLLLLLFDSQLHHSGGLNVWIVHLCLGEAP